MGKLESECLKVLIKKYFGNTSIPLNCIAKPKPIEKNKISTNKQNLYTSIRFLFGESRMS